MRLGTCPACGWQTLDAVRLMPDGADRLEPLRQTMLLFECSRCAWFGTATAPGSPQGTIPPSR